jgi:ketosteroid isomerase-like protein
MTQLQADALARRYIETLGAGQIDDCLGLFDDAALIKFPESIVGARSLSKAQFGVMMKNAPHVFETWPTYTLVEQTSQGNRSCIEFTGAGRMKNGAPFRNEYCIVFIAAHGQIVEMREYLDTSALQAAAKPVTS